jgi:hypothetical protein
MEALAYSWFNRVATLRFMELHDCLGHGHRALSSREGVHEKLLRPRPHTNPSGWRKAVEVSVAAAR